MWLFFALISMCISGFLDIIEKKGSKDQPEHFWAIAVLTYGIFNIVLGLILHHSELLNFNFITLLLTFPISFLSTLGYYCSVQAFKHSDISVVSPIFRLKIIWVLILSTIFLKDQLSILQVLFIFLLLLLNVLLNKNNKSTKSKKGILYALGFLFANGTATFFNKVVVNIVADPISISFYSGFTTILSIFLILIFIKKLNLLNLKQFKNKKIVLIMETLEVIAMLLTRYALLEGNVVIITAMNSSSVIIAIILSRIMFKEKIDKRKWIIISLIVIALAMLSIISI